MLYIYSIVACLFTCEPSFEELFAIRAKALRSSLETQHLHSRYWHTNRTLHHCLQKQLLTWILVKSRKPSPFHFNSWKCFQKTQFSAEFSSKTKGMNNLFQIYITINTTLHKQIRSIDSANLTSNYFIKNKKLIIIVS